jgi:ribosomal protein S27AE
MSRRRSPSRDLADAMRVATLDMARVLDEYAQRGAALVAAVRPSIECPRCGRISHHPDDVREGYCGACHDWTTPR